MAYLKMATAKPAANTLATLYTIGAVSGLANLIICNTGKTSTYVDVAISATTTPTADEYFIKGLHIDGGSTVEFKDLIVTATENVMVTSGTADITYRLCGNVA